MDFKKTNKTKLSAIPNYGDHMTKADFVGCVKCGGFIDYDGHGKYATKHHMTDIIVKPSQIKTGGFDDNYTHVVWFNR